MAAGPLMANSLAPGASWGRSNLSQAYLESNGISRIRAVSTKLSQRRSMVKGAHSEALSSLALSNGSSGSQPIAASSCSLLPCKPQWMTTRH